MLGDDSYYAHGGDFWAGREDSFVGTDKGMANAQDVASPDELDSPQQHRVFAGLSTKIFKSFKTVKKSFKPSRQHMEGSVSAQPARARLIAGLKKPATAVPKQSVQAQSEQQSDGEPTTSPKASSIESSGSGPSHQPSRPSPWGRSPSMSPAPVTEIAASRAKKLLAAGHSPYRPVLRKPPQWLKPEQEYLASGQTGTALTGSGKPLPPVPSQSSTANVGTPSTSQQGAQTAQIPMSAQPMVQSRPAGTRRPPSEISFTSCEMFCMWFWRSAPSWKDEYPPLARR
ncbi:hypothetical protein BS17DRAFT_778148 [Gyrodon lividus]|nr:hypothetical protein BS17DRAFT_778148 [Gyrodon lividus]